MYGVIEYNSRGEMISQSYDKSAIEAARLARVKSEDRHVAVIVEQGGKVESVAAVYIDGKVAHSPELAFAV